MSSQVVKVEREKLVACITCSLCNNFFRDATTISECLHTFCRKCIYKKLTEEEFDKCPVCNIDLGCAPMEKLRSDNSLQDLRCKLFPSQGHKAKKPEHASLLRLPARRKERNLSKLMNTKRKVSANSDLIAKRSKIVRRKNRTLQESTIPVEEYIRQVEGSAENLRSPETLSKIAQNKRQISSTMETSKQYMLEKVTADNDVKLGGQGDSLKSSNCLVEASSQKNSIKLNAQETCSKPSPLDIQDNEAHAPNPNVKDCGSEPNAHGHGGDSTLALLSSAKPKRVRQKQVAASEGLNIPAQVVVDASSKCNGRYGPIWFSLVASEDQKGDAPLPQITSCYLRVKSGSLPVSIIKKYLVKKLDLTSEAEVEISVRGQPVLSTLQLNSIVEWWVQTSPASERIQTFAGSSAKDFVMVLSYGRKVHVP
ncbi:zf-C3HC4_2 domain-containing protein, partial [Cephalotus follicularis]